MNVSKRNFTDFNDKKHFPGVIDDTTGEYQFPSLFHTDSNDNIRQWNIKIRLIKKKYIKKEIRHCIDWDVIKDDTVKIKKSYLNNTDIPEGTISQMWVETGVIGGKNTRHIPTYPNMKNEGKSNERNSLEQALVDARTLYLKKIENGLRIKKEFSVKKLDLLTKNIKYFPMLVRKFKDEKKNLEYPLYIQPKLDGARCITYLDKSPAKNPTFENVIMYSRQKKNYTGFNAIRKELLSILIDLWDFNKNESIYIDGELYKHGLSLQTISGAVRNPNRSDILEYKGIQYWTFDVFYPSNLNLNFKNRLEILNEIFEILDSKLVIKVPTHIVKSEIEQDDIYKKYLTKKYEGIIIRNSTSLYLADSEKNSMKIRSKYVLKQKMTYSDEFEVVDFDQGKKGKDVGAIMWILKTHNGNKTFNATPKNITYEERYNLYNEVCCNDVFKNKYKGRQMTIEYEDLSKDNVPLRAKSIGFREHL
jgi:curved DNA-binding protein CbpA